MEKPLTHGCADVESYDNLLVAEIHLLAAIRRHSGRGWEEATYETKKHETEHRDTQFGTISKFLPAASRAG